MPFISKQGILFKKNQTLDYALKKKKKRFLKMLVHLCNSIHRL